MKMLKRAGAIAIAGAMALTLGSVAYAADPTITVGDINIGEADGNGIVTVTVPYTAENLADGAQVTLLAELGAAEKAYASNIVYDTTAYIDQDAAGSAFTFKINENRLTGTKDADVWLNVKVGGTGVATAAQGSVQAYDYKEVVDPITSDMVTGALSSVNGVVQSDVLGLTGAGLMRLDVSSLITDEKLDLATQVVTIDGNEAMYTSYNDVTKLVALVDSSVAVHEIKISASTSGSTQLVYGDLTDDGEIKAADLSSILSYMLTSPSATSFTDYTAIKADTTGDAKLGAADMSELLTVSLDTTGTVLPEAATK